MRFCFWKDIQSQFWARRLFPLLLDEVVLLLVVSQERAVQPSLTERPKVISVRTLRARMSGRGTRAPWAMPGGLLTFGSGFCWTFVVVLGDYPPSISSRYAGQFLRIAGSNVMANSRTSCQFFLADFWKRSA